MDEKKNKAYTVEYWDGFIRGGRAGRANGYEEGLQRALELTFMQMAKGNYSFREGWIAALAELRTRIQEELDNGR